MHTHPKDGTKTLHIAKTKDLWFTQRPFLIIVLILLANFQLKGAIFVFFDDNKFFDILEILDVLQVNFFYFLLIFACF